MRWKLQTTKDICLRWQQQSSLALTQETRMKGFWCSFQPWCSLDHNYLKQSNNNTNDSATRRQAIKTSLSAASFITITSFQLKQNLPDITSPLSFPFLFAYKIRPIVWGALRLNSMHCDSQNENVVLYAHWHSHQQQFMQQKAICHAPLI